MGYDNEDAFLSFPEKISLSFANLFARVAFLLNIAFRCGKQLL